MESSADAPKFETNLMTLNEKCEQLRNKTGNVEENFTITNEVLYRNESELNDLERFVRDTLVNGIEESKTEIYIYSFMFIIGLIGLCAMVAKRFGPSATSAMTCKGEPSRRGRRDRRFGERGRRWLKYLVVPSGRATACARGVQGRRGSARRSR